jgi:hypothetical protein
MSNPFATFRKNRNYWMAGLVLLAILAFVVAPAIDQMSQTFSGGAAEKAVVVSWDGGRMSVADVRNATQKHGSLVRFLSTLGQEVLDAGGQPQVPGFAIDPESGQIAGLGIQASSEEIDVCRTRILATQAARMGIVFDDAAADEFLIAFCNNVIPTSRLETILLESTDGRLSAFEVRELLKQELAAMVVGQTARTGIYTQVPGETFQGFLKLNQSAQVEAFPVFVDDYLDQVKGTPSETEIAAIYDLGINNFANPNSPEPGFLRPYQANIEYVQANMQQWIDREKAKLTEEQLRVEYERRVALGQLQTPVNSSAESSSSDAANSETPAAAPDAEPSPSEESKSSSDAATPTPPTSTEPATPVETTDSPNSAPQEDQPPAAGNEGQLELSPTDAPPAGEGVPEPQNEQAARSKANEAIRLVAYQPQVEEGTDLPPPVVQPPQLDAGQANAETTAAPAGQNAEGTDAVSETQSTPMRTQTFEEAREMIADSLARDAAIPALDKALTTLLQDIMLPYFGAYRQYAAYRDSEIEGLEPVEKPVKPNLKKFAEDNSLTFGETGMIDGFKLSQTQFGQSNIQDAETGISGSLANVVSNPQIQVFRPLRSMYFDQAALMQGGTPDFIQYTFWKAEDRQAYRPTLEEARDEVIAAWKQQQARVLAEEAAQALAKKVDLSSDDPWSKALSTAEQALVVTVDPFTWMTRFGEFTMTSNVPRLDAVGGEFMQDVFSTPASRMVTAPNEGRNIYYVVRVQDFSPAQEELQQRFNADPQKSGPLSIARQEVEQTILSWYQNLESELNVQWEMPLDQLQ